MKNTIKRNAKEIYGNMLIDTSANKIGDAVKYYKDEYDRWIMLNLRTNEKFQGNLEIARNCMNITKQVTE